MEPRPPPSPDPASLPQQRWELLFEQSPLSIQIFAPDGQTVRFNQAWRDLFRLDDAQGLAFNVLQDPDLNATGAVHLIRQAFAGQAVTVPAVPFPVNTTPPETRWIGGVLYPVKDADGKVLEVVTIHHDITEMKRAEEAMLAINQTLETKVAERTRDLLETQAELAKALEQERELLGLKSRFVNMVSHEFRTPLGVAVSAVDLLRHYEDRIGPERRRELQDDIDRALGEMSGLMEQVLFLGRVGAGKVGGAWSPIDLAKSLHQIVDETLAATPGTRVVHRQCPTDLADARGDATLLRHIVSNLVGNAMKYSPQGTDVRVSVRREGRMAVIGVADHGIGIPEKDRDRLFEAFHRCGNAESIPGTGLGLSIVKTCVDAHGGEIRFESEEGRGTTFTVRLPLFEG